MDGLETERTTRGPVPRSALKQSSLEAGNSMKTFQATTALQRGPSLAEQAYAAIQELIISGAITSETVLSENDLSRQLSISRSPLREAIRRLQDEGMLNESGPRGFSVPPITTRFVAQLYQVRRALEGEAALLARDIPSEEMNAVREMMERVLVDLSEGRSHSFADADAAFHNLYIHRCGNPMLLHLIARLQGPLARVRVFANPLHEHLRASVQEHLAALDAMATGKPELVQQAVVAHIDGISARLLSHLESSVPSSDSTTGRSN
ncbi:GntR family transcriptional regulator [Leucobacter tenebrionis]|uniref:GntR family transcriptional regulator n=1 Tax=Leucobacter tenebrionis TaxID=2873270 RepID=UPI001CA6B8E5|nr:GntR family transcriptional regulator [Leucobacter tenebrionis]QZY50787.1 GntR family transcriptional regulator [Leucobacter tenebrionis]